MFFEVSNIFVYMAGYLVHRVTTTHKTLHHIHMYVLPRSKQILHGHSKRGGKVGGIIIIHAPTYINLALHELIESYRPKPNRGIKLNQPQNLAIATTS